VAPNPIDRGDPYMALPTHLEAFVAALLGHLTPLGKGRCRLAAIT
jgi:hypothetical protein